jgi:hypothetical protein
MLWPTCGCSWWKTGKTAAQGCRSVAEGRGRCAGDVECAQADSVRYPGLPGIQTAPAVNAANWSDGVAVLVGTAAKSLANVLHPGEICITRDFLLPSEHMDTVGDSSQREDRVLGPAPPAFA